MNRRTFITCTATAACVPGLLMATGTETADYKPGLIAQKLAAGETVFVDYAADWCGTCKRQERVINALRQSDSAYDEHITFIRVDWDQYGSADVATSRNVPRRSTLLLLRGDEELGRIVAGTRVEDIEALLSLGLPT